MSYKDAQKKVRDEIFRVLGDGLIPSLEQQKELKYMNMVINENLRLYPPVCMIEIYIYIFYCWELILIFTKCKL